MGALGMAGTHYAPARADRKHDIPIRSAVERRCRMHAAPGRRPCRAGVSPRAAIGVGRGLRPPAPTRSSLTGTQAPDGIRVTGAPGVVTVAGLAGDSTELAVTRDVSNVTVDADDVESVRVLVAGKDTEDRWSPSVLWRSSGLASTIGISSSQAI